MIKLENNMIAVELDPHGAEMKTVYVNGENRLWCGDPTVWAGRAPVLFPICGGLPDDMFTFEGKEYHLKKHGFARFMDFEVVSVTDTSVTFLLESNSETLKQYPFAFCFYITYTLRGSAIDIGYQVKNTDDKTMYFSIGSHEAYACPEGIEDYDLLFEKGETLNACDLDGNLIAPTMTPILKESKFLPVYEKFFAVDALVFKDVKSREVTLRNRKTGKSVSVKFDGFPYLLFWTNPGAPYLRIEPWTGIPPMVGSTHDITQKEGITALDAQDTFTRTHTIHF